MRNKFNKELDRLEKSLIELGAIIDNSLKLTNELILSRDMSLVEKISENEQLIDDKEKEIENFCLTLILQQHPVAKDFRFVSSSLKMITDMERIGDQTRDIAEISKYISHFDDDRYFKKISEMCMACLEMFKNCMETLIKSDENKAKDVIIYDDVIDELFLCLKNDIIEEVKADKGSEGEILDILMIGKYFERIGDHITNIAEWVIYDKTGIHESF
ncbi:MAG: phosphate signaling complex protein PhoU [Lachnospirales bacterium]